MWWAILVCLGFPAAGWFSPVWADPGVFPEAAPPGATVTISGKGFGQFKTTQDNRVLFNGSPALIQRWEPDLLEVKVPLRATSGPVEVIRGKKRIAVGSFSVQRPTMVFTTSSSNVKGTLWFCLMRFSSRPSCKRAIAAIMSSLSG